MIHRLALPLLLLLTLACGAANAAAANLDFTLHKLDSGKPGKTMLVVGGIQGDEPGGFNAASLLVSHYHIKTGAVWVVPNLNFISIINRCRGVYGDLNRKFSLLKSSDPEYATIEKIKSIILDPRVDIVLNHHDGSGFFRTRHEDRFHNPDRWGQSVIVDQERIHAPNYGELGDLARMAASRANEQLYSDEHRIRVKNTRTRQGDKEMEKTLTYFAIKNGKPAFGVEASKAFPTHLRAFYHLRVMEAFMDKLGIEYEREFPLTAQGVREAINSNVALAFFDNKILLDLEDARGRLHYIPLQKNKELAFTASNPLLAVVGASDSYKVFYGNRRVTRLHPQYFEYDHSIDELEMTIDGSRRHVRLGELVNVHHDFTVAPREGYRVNIIGYTQSGLRNEVGVPIRESDIRAKYSVDKHGKIFRVEVYKGPKFTGMVLVDFRGTDKKLKLLSSRNVSELPEATPPQAPTAGPAEGR